MERSLVVGIDGSEGSVAALDWAADEAQRANLPLRLVHASLWERYESEQPDWDDERPQEQGLVEDLVAEAQGRVGRLTPHVSVTTTVRPEDPVGALLSESRDAAMVIVGSRGRGQIRAMLLGSTSLAVAGQAACAVVVVRGGKANRAAENEKIILGVGESPGATVPARFALREAVS